MPAVKVGAASCDSQPHAASDEPQLIQQLRRGERAALERLVAEHHARIARLVSRLSGWTGETDDLVQDVFVKALTGAKHFRGDSRISTWLTSIAVNVCRGHHRTRLVRATFWKRWMSRRVEPADDEATEPAEQRERIKRVSDAVRRLKSMYREVVVLHYLEGMSSDDIGRVLGISRNTVEVRLHRARQMLRETLGPMMELK
jgi:RNA polymerase sigma-70 factor, ECF subfamily